MRLDQGEYGHEQFQANCSDPESALFEQVAMGAASTPLKQLPQNKQASTVDSTVLPPIVHSTAKR